MANGGWGPPPGGGGYNQPPGFGQPQGGYNQPPGFGPPPGMPPGWQPQQPMLDGGVPWESASGGLLMRWWQTIGATLKGRPFFAAVALNDDAMSAVTFHTMTLALMGFVFGLFYLSVPAVLGTVLLGALSRTGFGLPLAGGAYGMGFGLWIAATLGGAVVGFVGPWVSGGIHHLILALFGGIPPDRSYAHTVRAHAYANAGATIFSALPYLGIGTLVTFALGIKNHLEAYEEMHHCGAGKALAAYFAPFVCSCCGCCGCVGMTLALGSIAPIIGP